MNSANMDRVRDNVMRRGEVEKELSQLYIRRAGKEKHISRIIPEYSEDWENDPAVKDSDKKGEEKMISAEMVLLVAERRDLDASEQKLKNAIHRRLEDMRRSGMHYEEMDAEFQRLEAAIMKMDSASVLGQRIIRQTGHIKRCMDQAIKFRVGSGGLSEPLKSALRGVDELEPMMADFFRLMEEEGFRTDLREKIKYCQIGGADWVWEVFDFDLVGLFTRLFHRPDLQRFSEVDVELLDVRFRVYNAMSRVSIRRSVLCGDVLRLGRAVGLLSEEE